MRGFSRGVIRAGRGLGLTVILVASCGGEDSGGAGTTPDAATSERSGAKHASAASTGANPALFDPELVLVDRGTPFVQFDTTPSRPSSIELGVGWGQLAKEADGDDLVVWVESDEAHLSIERPETRFLELTGRLRPLSYPDAPPQELTVEVDGRELARLTLGNGWQTFRIPIDREDLQPGRNDYVLRFSRATRPSDISESVDNRRLAARFAWLGLLPAGLESPVRTLRGAVLDAASSPPSPSTCSASRRVRASPSSTSPWPSSSPRR